MILNVPTIICKREGFDEGSRCVWVGLPMWKKGASVGASLLHKSACELGEIVEI